MNSRHVRNTLQFVIDDELRDELDESKHVDCLSEGGDDERVPASVCPFRSELSRLRCQSHAHR